MWAENLALVATSCLLLAACRLLACQERKAAPLALKLTEAWLKVLHPSAQYAYPSPCPEPQAYTASLSSLNIPLTLVKMSMVRNRRVKVAVISPRRV